MTTRAFEYMPKLRSLNAVRAWTGFRPATPDNLPYIGRIPGFENVYAAAGHEGLGITTSLGTAELIADEIMGREAGDPARTLQPVKANFGTLITLTINGRKVSVTKARPSPRRS